jgi:hypothetical protein
MEYMQLKDHNTAPFPLLGAVFFVLIVLTIISILAGRIDFENYNRLLLPLPVNLAYLNDIIVLAVAFIQAGLVAGVFMGLYFRKPMYTIVLLTGCLFLGILFTLMLADTMFRGEVDKREAMRVAPVEQVDKPQD